MAAPYDFTLNAVNPAQSFVQGLQTGTGIQQIGAQQAQQQLQQQAEQQKLQAQQQQQAALSALWSNPSPTAEDYRRTMVVAPGLSEHLKRSWEVLNGDQQQQALSQAGQVYAALQSNRPDLAKTLLQDRAAALKNSGGKPEEIKAAETMAQLVETDPAAAAKFVGLRLATAPGGEKVFEALGKQGTEARAAEQAPADLRKKSADATTSEVTAKYADQVALQEQEKRGWDIKALQNDIEYKKQANRIAAMNAAASKEGNALKREELGLKIQETRQAMADKVREKVATAEAGANSIDNMLNTIERVKKNPSLNDVLGSIEGRLPSLLSDTGADAIALIDTLGSQAFLAQIPSIKGMGALSNAEGEKLQSALQNLNRKQGEAQFRANLDEAARLLTKSRTALSKSSGVPLGKPDTPAAPGARPPLSSFGG